MLFDALGNYRPIGQTHREFIFNAGEVNALPYWLTLNGTATPVGTFNAIGAGQRGTYNMATKVATPAIDDAVSLETPVIDTSLYSEIGFFAHGIQLDSGALPANVNLRMLSGDAATNGFFYQSEFTAEAEMSVRLYPEATKTTPIFQLMTADRILQRKNFGVIIRPLTREFFVTTGDPKQGGAVVFYRRGYTNSAGVFQIYLRCRTAARRNMDIAQLILRLSEL